MAIAADQGGVDLVVALQGLEESLAVVEVEAEMAVHAQLSLKCW